jgi:hypothetical protein
MKLLELLSTNWYNLFYWLTVSDSVKQFFDMASNIFSWFTVIGFIVLVICSAFKASTISEKNLETKEEEEKNSDYRAWDRFRGYAAKFFYTVLGLAMLTWLGYVLTPTKKDCLLIVAGGAATTFITSDSSARGLPSDVTRYLHLSLREQINSLTDKAKQEIGLDSITTTPVKKTVKDNLIDKAKNLSKEELIKYLEADTTIAK